MKQSKKQLRKRITELEQDLLQAQVDLVTERALRQAYRTLEEITGVRIPEPRYDFKITCGGMVHDVRPGDPGTISRNGRGHTSDFAALDEGVLVGPLRNQGETE